MFQSKKGRSESSLGSLQRFTDLRKEAPSRAKHLKNALSGLSAYERRGLLEQCSVESFHLFTDLLVWAAGVSGRAGAEVLELALFTLEQLLLHLPDLVGQKWEYHAISAAIRRFLHPHNDPLLRRRALKLFLYWYQILGVSKHGPDLPDLDALFQLLVPHFPHSHTPNSEALLQALCENPTCSGPVQPPKHTPLLPSSEKASAQSQSLQEFLESLLKGLSYVANVEWPHKKQYYQLKSFRFLLGKFQEYYIPSCFPRLADSGVDLSRGLARLPPAAAPPLPRATDPMHDPLIICKYCIIRWVNLYTLSYKSADSLGQSAGLVSEAESPRTPGASSSTKLPNSYALIRGVLFESLPNTNFTLTLLREGLLLPLPLDRVIHRIVRTLREWLFQEVKGPWEESEDVAELVRGDAAMRTLVEVLGWWYWNPYLGDDWTRTATATLSLNSKILALLKDLASPQRPPPIQLTRESWAVILRTLLGMVGRVVPVGVESGDDFSRAVATPLFQTLLITWVLGSAVCRIPLPPPLWDSLRELLTPRAAWPQLLDEWSKVMESSTRALGTSVYGVDLMNAPLDRKRGHEQIKSGSRIGRKEILSRTDRGSPATPTSTPRSDGEHIDFCEPILPELLNKRGSVIANSTTSPSQHSTSSSPPTSGVEEGKGSDHAHSKPSTTNWEHSGSEADHSLDSANPESISIGGETSSIHSAEFGVLGSDRDSEKTSLFNEAQEATPSPDLEDELTEGEDDAHDDVEITPRFADSEDSGSLWASVWRRIFGSIGPFHNLGLLDGQVTPATAPARLKAVKALGKILHMLLRIADNQGIPDDGKEHRQVLDLTPPHILFAPILLRLASDSSKDMAKSREEAMKQLCRLLVGRRQTVDPKMRAEFYLCLHQCLEDGVTGAAEEMLAHVSRHILSDPHLLLLQDALSAAEQVVNSQLSGTMLSNASRSLAAIATIPGSFPLQDEPGGRGRVRERAGRALIRVLAFSASRVTPDATTAAINGLAMMLHSQQSFREPPPPPDPLAHDSLDALISCLQSKQHSTGLLVVQALAPLLAFPSSALAPPVIEAFVDVLESRRSVRDANDLCERLLLELCEWLVLPKPSTEANSHLSGTVLWALASCCESNSCPGLHACAKAATLSISRHLNQFPLPQFGLSLSGSTESELSLHPSHQLFVASGPEQIWTTLTLPSSDALFLLSRGQAGKALWTMKKMGDSRGREATKGDELLAKLRSSMSAKSRVSPAPSLEQEDTGLRELLEHLKTTSPECVGGEEVGLLPHEADIRGSLGAAALYPSTYSPRPEPKAGRAEEGRRPRLWARLLGDLALTEPEFVHRLAPLADSPAQVARKLKHLDSQLTRIVHKLAVIYVGNGQEDKESILRNERGSEGFEEFVRGLGWEVEVGSHAGYAGGLSAATTAYHASLTSETLFHVSTHLPPSDHHNKLRHLGNDEIHIIWSENEREYRRALIPTDFCDVLIIIYPLSSNLFRIQISTTKDGLEVGPLMDGMVVEGGRLAELVRRTAGNASAALRRGTEGWVAAASQRLSTLADLTRPLPHPPFAPLLLALLAPPPPAPSLAPILNAPTLHDHILAQASAPVNV